MRWAYIVLPPYRFMCFLSVRALMHGRLNRGCLNAIARQALFANISATNVCGDYEMPSRTNLYWIDHWHRRALTRPMAMRKLAYMSLDNEVGSKSRSGLGANLLIVSQRLGNGSRQLVHLTEVSLTKPYARVSSVGIDRDAASLG